MDRRAALEQQHQTYQDRRAALEQQRRRSTVAVPPQPKPMAAQPHQHYVQYVNVPMQVPYPVVTVTPPPEQPAPGRLTDESLREAGLQLGVEIMGDCQLLMTACVTDTCGAFTRSMMDRPIGRMQFNINRLIEVCALEEQASCSQGATPAARQVDREVFEAVTDAIRRDFVTYNADNLDMDGAAGGGAPLPTGEGEEQGQGSRALMDENLDENLLSRVEWRPCGVVGQQLMEALRRSDDVRRSRSRSAVRAPGSRRGSRG